MSNLVLSFKLYALAVIISVLVAILIKAVVLALSVARKKPVTKDTESAQIKHAPEPAVSDIPAIAAAVYSMIGAHRIVHIETGQARGPWIHEGRILHQTSHAVRHAPRQK